MTGDAQRGQDVAAELLEQSSHLVVTQWTVAAWTHEQLGEERVMRRRAMELEREGARRSETERARESKKGGEFKLSAMFWDRLIC